MIAYGSCLAQCRIIKQTNTDDETCYDIPVDIHELNATACRKWNREGCCVGSEEKDSTHKLILTLPVLVKTKAEEGMEIGGSIF